jgi:hypothetical protein
MAGNIRKLSFRNPLLHRPPPFPHPPKPPSQTDVVNLYIGSKQNILAMVGKADKPFNKGMKGTDQKLSPKVHKESVGGRPILTY